MSSIEKPCKLFDERGVFLLVTPSAGRLWRLRCRMDGREKLLALGAYPDITLKRAREKRDDARRLIADGIDLSARRKAQKGARGKTCEAVINTALWRLGYSRNEQPDTGSAAWRARCSTSRGRQV